MPVEIGETPALDERVGWLVPLVGCTDAWSVDIKIPAGACLCGGMSADAEMRSLQPWATRNEYLQRLAQESDTRAEGEDEQAAPLETRFRRDDGRHICVTGNMLRTLLQETGRAIYADDNGWFVLRRALRYSLRIEPTLLQIKRRGEPITTPDGILEIPRLIKAAPYERSILQRPEYVKGPVEISFLLLASRIGTGSVVTGETLEYMLEYAGSYIGLGAHRGVDQTLAGQPGVFEVVDFSPVDLATVVGTARARRDPPPLVVPTRRKGKKVTEELDA